MNEWKLYGGYAYRYHDMDWEIWDSPDINKITCFYYEHQAIKWIDERNMSDSRGNFNQNYIEHSTYIPSGDVHAYLRPIRPKTKSKLDVQRAWESGDKFEFCLQNHNGETLQHGIVSLSTLDSLSELGVHELRFLYSKTKMFFKTEEYWFPLQVG